MYDAARSSAWHICTSGVKPQTVLHRINRRAGTKKEIPRVSKSLGSRADGVLETKIEPSAHTQRQMAVSASSVRPFSRTLE